MNWDAIGSIGEIVGAGAVVVSLVYLAIQIRKQTVEARLLATRELASDYQRIINTIATDDTVSRLWAVGVQDYDSMPDMERMRISAFFQQLARHMEQQFLHTTKGTVDPAFFKSVDRVHLEFLCFPGVQQWWEGSKEFFDKEFQDHVRMVLIKAKAKGYHSSFKKEKSELLDTNSKKQMPA